MVYCTLSLLESLSPVLVSTSVTKITSKIRSYRPKKSSNFSKTLFSNDITAQHTKLEPGVEEFSFS